MTRLPPSQMRTALDVFTGLVVISVAVALAGLTWRIAGHAGTGAVTVPSGNSAPAAVPDLGPAMALAPFGKSTSGEGAQPTSLPLTLTGLISASPASMSTAFIANGSEPAKPFHVGETVGGATIEGIARDRVLLNVAGRIEYLTFPIPNPPPGSPGTAPNAPAVTPASPGMPPNVPPPPPAAPNPAALIQRLNAAPTEGGYRVGAGAPAGLRSGDVIQSVDGIAAGNQAAMTSAMAAAQTRGSVQIQLLRDGKSFTVTVPTR